MTMTWNGTMCLLSFHDKWAPGYAVVREEQMNEKENNNNNILNNI